MIVAAFGVRSFRFQWAADLLTSWAFEMETIVLGWYVMVQTGSVVWLTAFGSLQLFGTLTAPMIGVLGDRLGARAVLCALRIAFATLAACLTVLALAGLLTPVWVLVIGALVGVVRPSDQVMRTSLVGETIPPIHLTGALAMSRATMDSARVAGALAGAALSTALGIGLTYVFVTAFYAASLALTFQVARRPPVPDPAAAPRAAPAGAAPAWATRRSRWRDLGDGLAHVRRTPALLAVMWLAFLVNLTAYPVSGGLLPYVARRVYQVDATGLGWLVASFAFGGLLASLTIVLRGTPRLPERTTLVCTAIWYALLLGFGRLQHLGAGVLTLLTAGFFQNVAMISMNVTLLGAAGDAFRSRVMGVRMLAVYGMPVGLIGAGILIEHIGYPATITVMAMTGLLFTGLIALRWRDRIWRRQPAAGMSAERSTTRTDGAPLDRPSEAGGLGGL